LITPADVRACQTSRTAPIPARLREIFVKRTTTRPPFTQTES
jgi:hypothetical protein